MSETADNTTAQDGFDHSEAYRIKLARIWRLRGALENLSCVLDALQRERERVARLRSALTVVADADAGLFLGACINLLDGDI
jgi:hypothetical protein